MVQHEETNGNKYNKENNKANKNDEDKNDDRAEEEDEIVTNIQQLQELESQLFDQLNNASSTAEKQALIEKINRLSTMRIQLYKTLNNIHSYYQKTLHTSLDTLKEQNVAIGIVETELNKSKRELTLLEAEKNNKLRLVEINNYYGERYEEHASLLKIIICILLALLVLALLWRYLPFLPKSIYYVLVSLVAIVGAYFFWAKYASIMTRNNMNYQTYDWYFNPGAATSSTSTSTTSTSSMDPWLNPKPLTCIGAACCTDGLTFDANTNVCVVTESFQNRDKNLDFEQIFTKKNRTREDYNVQGSVIQSYNS